jgi:hypothetical protein
MGSLSVWVDESEKGDILVVAGVLADWAAVPKIVRDWRQVKAGLGLPPEAEVKWNLPSGHPTRQALERGRRTTKDLCVKATDFIAGRHDLTCVAVVMLEQRNIPLWKKLFWSKASVRDFYCEGLKYLIQRVAEEVVEAKLQDCIVVCDTPELGTKSFASGAIRRGPRAVEKTYGDWYRHGVSVGPGRKHHGGPLADIGFHPSILIGDATYHDMLQIADVVAGVTREWVVAVRDNRANSWEVDCFKAVSVRFRTRHGNPDFFGDGFVLWPWDNELWTSLQRSVR